MTVGVTGATGGDFTAYGVNFEGNTKYKVDQDVWLPLKPSDAPNGWYVRVKRSDSEDWGKSILVKFNANGDIVIQ